MEHAHPPAPESPYEKMHKKFLHWYQDAWEVFEKHFDVTSLVSAAGWNEGIKNQIYRSSFDDDRDPIFLSFEMERSVVTKDVVLFNSTYKKFVEIHGFIEPECFFPISWEEVKWMLDPKHTIE